MHRASTEGNEGKRMFYVGRRVCNIMPVTVAARSKG